MSVQLADLELKARHRAMWGSGNYPLMVDTFLLPVGERLVDACGIGPGMRVLDVAAGTGNASLPAARRGAAVTASDLTPALLEVGRGIAGLPSLNEQHEWQNKFVSLSSAGVGPQPVHRLRDVILKSTVEGL